jgi:hypothetical protein
MARRDLAVVAFRVLALWPIVTGLTQALETVIAWDVAYRQVARGPNSAALALSPREFFLITMAPFGARVVVGVLLWVFSGSLARLAAGPDGGPTPLADRRTLYLSAMFLVGVWLLASAVPTAAYWLFWAVRTGWRPQQAEEGAQLAELAIRGLVGATLLRGDWLLPSELRNGRPEDGGHAATEPGQAEAGERQAGADT